MELLFRRNEETEPVIFNLYNTYDIDIGVLPYVLFFNTIGLTTKFSCYGHFECDPFSIIFDDMITREMIDKFISDIGVAGMNFMFYDWRRLQNPYDENSPLLSNMTLVIDQILMANKQESINHFFKSMCNTWKKKHPKDNMVNGKDKIITKKDVVVKCPYCQNKMVQFIYRVPSVESFDCSSCGNTIYSIITDENVIKKYKEEDLKNV